MDLVVDDNGGVSVNFVVGAKRAKSCVNTSLSPAFDSHFKAKRCSSNESVYEVIAESVNGDSENEICYSDCDSDLHQNMNGKLNVLENSQNLNQNGSQDPSDSAEMDETFVIIEDDGNDSSDEKSDCNEEMSKAKENLLDCDNMDEILKEFAVEGGKSDTRLSNNEEEAESAVDELDATETKREKKTTPRVILSSDDDAIDSLLDDFREESSLDENSAPLSGNSDATSALVSDKLKPSANNDFNILKSLPVDGVNNKITSSYSGLHKARRKKKSFNRTNSAKNKNVEIITVLTDEKSNDSDNSSIQIIDDDDDSTIKENSQNKSSKNISQTTLPKLSSPLNSPSFSSSSEDKFEFDRTILDIVDETSSDKVDKRDNSDSKSTEKLNNSPHNEVTSFMSNVDLLDNKSNVSSIHKNENYVNEVKIPSICNTPSTNVLGESMQLPLNKSNCDNKKQSDTSSKFLSCNGNVSSNSESSSSQVNKEDTSNSSTERKAVAADNEGNDELLTSNGLNVSSKQASCTENKKSTDLQINSVNFHTELLNKEKSSSAESLEEKNSKSCNVTNTDPLKTDFKNETYQKTKLNVKSDTKKRKTSDDFMETEQKINYKCEIDNKKPEIKSDSGDDRKTIDNSIEAEEKKTGNRIELLHAFESEQSDGQFLWTFHSSGKEKDVSQNCYKNRKPDSNFWFREVKIRKTGRTKGKCDVYYYPKPNIRLRSLKDIKRYCEKEKIPYDPKQFDFVTKSKINKKKSRRLKEIRKVISLSSLGKNIMKEFEEAVYNLCDEHSVVAVCNKVEISRSQLHGVISKIAEKEMKADAETKMNSILKSDSSNENKIMNFKFEVADDKCQWPEDVLNKRKLEDHDEIKVKKLKSENESKEDTKLLNGDISSIESSSLTLTSSKLKNESEVERKVLDTVDALLTMLGKPNKKIEITKKSLDQLALCFSIQPWKEDYTEALNTIKLLENKLQELDNIAERYQTKIAECKEFQRNKFTHHSFRPKVPTRTVGVNVKIYRESEIKSAMLQNATKVMGKNSVSADVLHLNKDNNVLSKAEPVKAFEAKTIATMPDNKLLVPNLQVKDTIITPVVPSTQVVRKQLLPRIITQTTRPQVMTLSSRIPPPNVTVSGNRLISVGRPTSSSVVLVPSSTITSSSTSRLATEENKLQKVVATGISSTAPAGTVAKMNVPGMANNPNVLVPLKDYLQLLPPGSKGAAVIQQPVSRPALIPPLPSSLVGARTVTYIVPQNSALGARGIQPFIPSQNQQVQFVLRVTNPGTVAGLNSVVNSVPRSSILQPPLATAPRMQPPVATAPQTVAQPPVSQSPVARNSGLILISHTSKHPAPFPKSPHYPDNKGKSIPPKPALKGSKNQSGIVLSWNMNLTNKNANIASYQLFAYQETDGPVDASLWKKVGDVNALPLPMACTLTQFVDKNRYYFTVRAVDVFQRFGPFSDPVSILFEKEGDSAKKDK